MKTPNEYAAYIRLNHFKEILSQFQAKKNYTNSISSIIRYMVVSLCNKSYLIITFGK